MLDQILDIRSGGQVTRYHTMRPVRCEDNATHTWNCLVLLDRLYPEASLKLRRYVLYHDVTEGLTGDTPWPAKRQSESLWKALHGLELEESLRLDLPLLDSLTDYEVLWFKAVDALDCCFFALDQAMLGHRGFWHVYQNGLGAVKKSPLYEESRNTNPAAVRPLLQIVRELEQAASFLQA
jgi:hypothetical protein